MVTLTRENPRYGYRRVWALLRCEGWRVNKKRCIGCGNKKASNTEEGTVRQPSRSKGPGRGVQIPLQPPQATQCSWYRTPVEFAASYGSASVEEALAKELESVTVLS
jgi:hypothetical protein